MGDDRGEAEDKMNVPVAKAKKAAETPHEFAMPVVVTEAPKSYNQQPQITVTLSCRIDGFYVLFLPNAQARVNAVACSDFARHST